MSLYASCFNAAISILMQDEDLKRPLPLSELEPAFSFVTDLFHGYEKQSDVKQVAYFDLNPEAEKLAEDQAGTVFRIDCPYREEYRDMRDKLWVLAVSDKGELSVEKTEVKALSRNSAARIPDTVFLTLPEGEKTAELTFYFISEDGTQYSSQSVTLTVPKPAAPPSAD